MLGLQASASFGAAEDAGAFPAENHANISERVHILNVTVRLRATLASGAGLRGAPALADTPLQTSLAGQTHTRWARCDSLASVTQLDEGVGRGARARAGTRRMGLGRKMTYGRRPAILRWCDCLIAAAAGFPECEPGQGYPARISPQWTSL
jgi:hypothetical protein